MKLMFGSQKGGVGKSTLAINTATYLANEGKDVVLMDCDPLGTSSRWAQDRDENPSLPTVHCVQKFGNIRATILDLAQRYEYVIVDVAGRDSSEMRTGLTAVDLLVMPFVPSNADLDTLPSMQEVISTAMDFNENLQIRALLSLAPSNPMIREVAQAREYFEDYPDIHVLNAVIRNRTIYRNCLSQGKGVVEMGSNKAKPEIQLLMQEILG